MTVLDLMQFLKNGGSIECFAPEQRNDLAKFISEKTGYQIGNWSASYMRDHPDGMSHMNVELLERICGDVVVAICKHHRRDSIMFDDIERLLEENSENNAMTDKEFSDAFAELMGVV